MAQKIVAGNWKMNGTKGYVLPFLDEMQNDLQCTSNFCKVILFFPFVYLIMAEKVLDNKVISYGAQTLSEFEDGAFTGEISGTMLKDIGCEYVLVGHSERRTLFAEDNELIAKKFAKAQQCDLTPLLCVGETLEQRDIGQTMAVVQQQLQAVIDHAGIEALSNSVIAYEPVWAIGTGKTATPEQAQEVHEQIRRFLAQQDKQIAQNISLLYGGSVKPDNAGALFAMPDIDGALVGGASLDANKFLEIVQAM